jgi:hypothetical protein
LDASLQSGRGSASGVVIYTEVTALITEPAGAVCFPVQQSQLAGFVFVHRSQKELRPAGEQLQLLDPVFFG